MILFRYPLAIINIQFFPFLSFLLCTGCRSQGQGSGSRTQDGQGGRSQGKLCFSLTIHFALQCKTPTVAHRPPPPSFFCDHRSTRALVTRRLLSRPRRQPKRPRLPRRRAPRLLLRLLSPPPRPLLSLHQPPPRRLRRQLLPLLVARSERSLLVEQPVEGSCRRRSSIPPSCNSSRYVILFNLARTSVVCRNVMKGIGSPTSSNLTSLLYSSSVPRCLCVVVGSRS